MQQQNVTVIVVVYLAALAHIVLCDRDNQPLRKIVTCLFIEVAWHKAKPNNEGTQ